MDIERQVNGAIKAYVETITPEIADEFLAINTHNRLVNQRTVDDYAEQMKRGLWRLNGEPIIISSDNVILDGQHRLLAVKKSRVTIQSLVVWGVDRHEAFVTIDTGRIRRAGDILSIANVPNANNIAAGITQYFSFANSGQNTAIFGNANGLRIIKKSKAEVLAFYNEHPELCQAIQSNSAKNTKRVRLIYGSTLFAIELFLILNKGYNMEHVFSFFDQLFSGENIENKTILVLRERLIAHATQTRVLTTSQRLTFIIKTWNAYVTGNELKILRYRAEDEGVPAFL